MLKKALITILLTLIMAVGVLPTANADSIVIVDVGSDYSLLPDTNGTYSKIVEVSLYDLASSSYHFTFDYNNSRYQFDVALPTDISIGDYLKSDSTWNISYTVVDNTYRVLYFQSNLELDPIPSGDGTVENPSELIDGFSTINLTTMEFTKVVKLQINTIAYKEGSRTAYMYAFMDPKIEDLLSISFEYQYRFNYLWGYGDWKEGSKSYLKGEESEIDPPSWLRVTTALTSTFFIYGVVDLLDIYNTDSFQTLDKSDIPDEVMDIYKDDLGGTEADLDELNLYKILIGQFQQIGSIGYDIQYILITDLMYAYQGVVYHAATEVIEQTNLTPPLTDLELLMQVLDWLIANWQYIVVTILAFVALILLGKVFKAIGDILKGIWAFITLIVKGIGYLIKYFVLAVWYVIKYIFIGLFYLLKAIFYWIPKGIINLLYVLFTPKEQRKIDSINKRKERSYHVS